MFLKYLSPSCCVPQPTQRHVFACVPSVPLMVYLRPFKRHPSAIYDTTVAFPIALSVLHFRGAGGDFSTLGMENPPVGLDIRHVVTMMSNYRFVNGNEGEGLDEVEMCPLVPEWLFHTHSVLFSKNTGRLRPWLTEIKSYDGNGMGVLAGANLTDALVEIASRCSFDASKSVPYPWKFCVLGPSNCAPLQLLMLHLSPSRAPSVMSKVLVF